MKMHYIYKVTVAVAVSALVACADVAPDGQMVAGRGRLTYRGGIADGKYEGYGQLSLGDSVIYAGQWHNGHRQGKGVCRDSLGRRVVGVWRADTLVHGVVTDTEGTYNGELNRDALPSGHGFYEGRDGTLYLGLWRDGMRHGFGFALDGSRHARVASGEWAATGASVCNTPPPASTASTSRDSSIRLEARPAPYTGTGCA